MDEENKRMALREYKKTLTMAIDTNGLRAQSYQAIEEMAELTHAICKWWRGSGEGQPLRDATIPLEQLRSHLAEEVADVQIMLDQLIIGYGIGLDVNEWIIRKVKSEREILEAMHVKHIESDS